jgi:hypothetical protein
MVPLVSMRGVCIKMECTVLLERDTYFVGYCIARCVGLYYGASKKDSNSLAGARNFTFKTHRYQE